MTGETVKCKKCGTEMAAEVVAAAIKEEMNW